MNDANQGRGKFLQPLIYAALILTGMLIGKILYRNNGESPVFFPFSLGGTDSRFAEALKQVEKEYVDTVNLEKLEENAINGMLQQLDPHSFFIPARELSGVNESLEGNFEGIGIEFNILHDTILVVSPISGGPSEQLGILSGDRIISIEGKTVAGIHITNKEVMGKLRGKSGTKVSIEILRGTTKVIPFTIERGKIPIFSVDARFMLNKETGYIKINRFAETTFEEYLESYNKLKTQGLKTLILDLRGNPGGYLQTAHQLADEYLGEGKLVVYTEGKSQSRKDYTATAEGLFESGRLFVLIDEGSASASEIVSGAVQDWDRGTIVGRRSFGKGLVQDQTMLSDSSALRLTVARYYTPSGRCIQKPYKSSINDYQHEVMDRLENGELESPDSAKFEDSLKYKTMVRGRTVYGGGGIMPDEFVPLDTTYLTPFLSMAFNGGLLTETVYDYLDKNKSTLSRFKTPAQFNLQYDLPGALFSDFIAKVKQENKTGDFRNMEASIPYLKTMMKALIARSLWQGDGYYLILSEKDPAIRHVLELNKKP